MPGAEDPKYTSIRLTVETARRLRVLAAGMKGGGTEQDQNYGRRGRAPDRSGKGYSANAAAIEAHLEAWQLRLSTVVGREVVDAHARIGDHVVEATTEFRKLLRRSVTSGEETD